jgi:carboxyl-terminal processing protease
MPVVVLVDGGTASASEIIAGALQDHDRALVLGTPTFGKGLVQTVYPLNGREFLKLTTGRWYTPSGRTIQRPMGQMVAERGEEEHRPDSGAAARARKDTVRVFHTSAGRSVYGGGGIRPDLVVRGDTLTDAEKEFARTLGAKVTVYRDVLTSYALELKGQGAVKSPGFPVTPAMRAELLRRLRARGVEIGEQQWAGAESLVSEQLSYEITRYLFGRPAEFARRVADDGQVRYAVTLLQRARTPQELLTLAQERPAK